jgi:large subunit ribosomal protein L24e
MKKRNQKPEVRKAQREQAIRAAKDLKKAKAQQKKPAAAATKVRKIFSKKFITKTLK